MTVTGLTTWIPPSNSSSAQDFSINGAGQLLANGGFTLDASLYNDTLTLDVGLTIGASSSWSNNTNGIVTISGTGNIINNGTITVVNPGNIFTNVTFTNNATLTKSSGNGNLVFNNTVVNNSGTVNADFDFIDFTLSYTQTGGTTSLGGGGLIGTSILITGGNLVGSGNINGNLTNNGGIIQPGGVGYSWHHKY